MGFSENNDENMKDIDGEDTLTEETPEKISGESTSEKEISEENAPEEESSEESAPEEKSSEESAPEEKSSEENASEEKSSEESAPEEKSSEENASEETSEKGLFGRIRQNRLYQYLLFPGVLVYYEILLRLFTGTSLFSHLFYPVIFALSFGFLLSGILSLFGPRLRWHLANVAMAVIAFYYGLEAVLRNTYKVYMSLSSIFNELGNVTGNYGGDVKNAFVGAIPIIIVYYIPFILHLVLWKKYKRVKRRPVPFLIVMLVLWFALGIIGTAFATHLPGVKNRYAAHYEYDTASRTFGLVENTFLSIKYSYFGNSKATELIVRPPDTETEAEAEGTTDILESEEEEAEEAIDYGYNVMDIDFDELIAETEDDKIKQIHEYVSSLEPTNKNEYTGLFEGKNLITISAESFCLQAINEELTPTLYRMANEGINFTDFYQPAWGGSTSTGEYSILLGLVPTNSTDSMLDTIGDNLYFTTGNQFQRLGYTSLAFHNGMYNYYDRDQTHPNLGYDSYTAWGNGLDDLLTRWSGDNDTFRATLETYIDKEPFNVYYMSYSGHCTYDADDPKVIENLPAVEAVLGDAGYPDKVLYYFCYQMEFEHALTTMVDMLEEAGIADDTVIVICPDHFPYGLAKTPTFGNDVDYLLDLYGVDSYDGFIRDKTAGIIWSPCLEDMDLEVDTPAYSLDILPTISNLFGLEYDSRLLVGRDVFSDALPLVVWADYSFLTEKGWYNADTDEFVSTTDEEVTDEYIDEIKTLVANKIAFSKAVVDYDYYGLLFGEDDVK